MPNKRTEVQKKRKYVPISDIWYQENPLEVAIMMWDLKMLSNDSISYNQPLKKIAKDSRLTQQWDRVNRDVEDRRRLSLSVATATSATSLDLSVAPANLIPWTTLYNKATGETAFVETVTGTTVTLAAPWFIDPAYQAWNVLQDLSYSKPYGIDAWKTAIRNDYNEYSNFMQFSEYQVQNDLIDSNKTYLNYESNDERQKEKISDAARDMMLDVMGSFYFGKQGTNVVWWNTHYLAWGLEEFTQAGGKVVLPQGNPAQARSSVIRQLRLAYSSGIKNIYKKWNLVLVCNSLMREYLTLAFSWDDITYNEKFSKYDNNLGTMVESVKFNGYTLTHAVSTYLDFIESERPLWFLLPIQEAAMFCLPNIAWTEEKGNRLKKFNTAVYYKKPRTIVEKETDAMFMNYSFLFNYSNTLAYQRRTA